MMMMISNIVNSITNSKQVSTTRKLTSKQIVGHFQADSTNLHTNPANKNYNNNNSSNKKKSLEPVPNLIGPNGERRPPQGGVDSI